MMMMMMKTIIVLLSSSIRKALLLLLIATLLSSTATTAAFLLPNANNHIINPTTRRSSSPSLPPNNNHVAFLLEQRQRGRRRQRHQRSSSLAFPLYASNKDPLVTEGDWSAYLDESNTGFIYYFNTKTGESKWEKPTKTFPNVVLDVKMEKVAIQKQKMYLSSQQSTSSSSTTSSSSATTTKKGFFQSILEPTTTTSAETTPQDEAGATADEQQQTEEGGQDWLNSLFDKTKKTGGTGTATTTTTTTALEDENAVSSSSQEEAKPQAGFFSGMFNAATGTAIPKSTTTTTSAPAKTDPIFVEETAPEPIPIQITSASYVLPHPAKIRWGGEDAVFVKGRTFGVFDGVSGAEKLDGVPLYSKTLADEMERRVEMDSGYTMQELNKNLAECADVSNQIATGASTAVVASIGEDGFLRVLNVGDSACLVIRNNAEVVAKTREISHYFECPYQLSNDSPDRPRDGTKLNIELVRGDLILMGSDGIFDNLSDDEVLDIVMRETQSSSKKKKVPLQTIAKRVSEMSRKVSLDRKAPTPYAEQAKKFGDPDYAEGLGGKVDDVSCVCVSYA